MTLEQRLEEVERENRRMRRIVVVAVAAVVALFVIGVAAVLLIGQAKGKPDLVVRSLKVIDEEGRVRAELGPFERHGSVLSLTDRDGKIRVGLGVWGGPYFGFADGKDTVLALGALPLPQDRTIDLDLHARLALNLVGDAAALVIKDQAGKVIWKAPKD